jgi:hypothetical protein
MSDIDEYRRPHETIARLKGEIERLRALPRLRKIMKREAENERLRAALKEAHQAVFDGLPELALSKIDRALEDKA